jgi:hypothetical protein
MTLTPNPAKVPPGDAGHPVCLDTPIEVRLKLLRIVGIVSKHSPRRSLTLSAPEELFVRSPNTRCVLQSAHHMLSFLQASTFFTVHSRYNAWVMSKVGLSDAPRREE